MPTRRADADQRRFLDEFPRVRVSRLRALGVIDPSRPNAVIPWPNGKTKLLRVGHTRLMHGGGYSYFVCPGCAKLAGVLYDIDDAPRCCKCCAAMNIHYRARMGFGRRQRREVCDARLDQLIAKVQAKEPLRLKPEHPTSRGRRAILRDSQRLTNHMRKRMIALRINQIASQHFAGQGLKSYAPIAAAKQLLDVKPIWRARTTETIAKALDKAQTIIIKALDDPNQRTLAAQIILRSKEARQRSL